MVVNFPDMFSSSSPDLVPDAIQALQFACLQPKLTINLLLAYSTSTTASPSRNSTTSTAAGRASSGAVSRSAARRTLQARALPLLDVHSRSGSPQKSSDYNPKDITTVQEHLYCGKEHPMILPITGRAAK